MAAVDADLPVSPFGEGQQSRAQVCAVAFGKVKMVHPPIDQCLFRRIDIVVAGPKDLYVGVNAHLQQHRIKVLHLRRRNRLLAPEAAVQVAVPLSLLAAAHQGHHVARQACQSLHYGVDRLDVVEGKGGQCQIERPLEVQPLYNKNVQNLSGGEHQRVAIAIALTRKSDLFLLDEPSAYLDSNQRMNVAKTIRRVMEKGATSALVVDHDIYFLDLISDSIIVFEGEGAKYGSSSGPFNLRTGMNTFLKNVDITFRRDTDSKRPRINKMGSRLDREQKSSGEYYYG